MSEKEMEADLKVLQVQQETLSSDMKEIKGSLSAIANSLSSLAVLEQKHVEARDGLKRAHGRIDSLHALVKDECKNHEGRLQENEIAIARNAWIERVIIVIVIAGVNMLLQ